jgi:hypothetical protein
VGSVEKGIAEGEGVIVHHCDQRTTEWMALRAGKLTGSAAKDMLASIKSGEAAARRDLRYKLVAERLSGQSQEDGYINAVMQWGIDHESEAIAAYEALTGNLVEPIGFVESDNLMVGTSPDGFVGDDGIVSIKCPKTATQIRYIREGVEPAEHVAQNTHELWLTGRAWIDFVSYDPRLPDGLRLFIRRVTRDEAALSEYATKALAFLRDVDAEAEALRTLTNLTGQLEASLA